MAGRNHARKSPHQRGYGASWVKLKKPTRGRLPSGRALRLKATPPASHQREKSISSSRFQQDRRSRAQTQACATSACGPNAGAGGARSTRELMVGRFV